MDAAFETWFTDVIRKWEGGTAERDPKDDPGGLTRHGVTIKYWMDKAHSIVNMPPTREALMGITWEDAKKIAYQDFWLGKKINTIANSALRPFVADSYWLGGGLASLGYKTIADLNKNKLESISGLYNKRMNYLKGLSNWNANKAGWTNRMNSVLGAAKKFGSKKTAIVAGSIAGALLASWGLYELNKKYKWV